MFSQNERSRSAKPSQVLYWCRRARTPLAFASLSVFLVAEIMLHLPPRALPRFGFDKVLHMLCYGTFTGLALLLLSLFFGWRFVWRTSEGLAAIALTMLTIALLGYADEITQPFTGRNFEWSDLGANLLGILICAVLFAVLGRLVTRPTVSVEA